MSVYRADEPAWLRESLESIAGQSIPPSEYVIVKDGPISEALEAALTQELANVSVPVIMVALPENRGLAEALRLGVEACSLDLIARMDADDIAVVNRMERQLAEFERDPSLDVVGSLVDEFEGSIDSVVARVSLPESHDEIVQFAKRRCPCRHPTLLYRKSAVLRAGNYSADMTLFEDWDLYNRMIRSGAVCRNIQSPLVHIRVSESFYSRRGGIDYLRRALRFRRRELDVGFSSLPDFLVGGLAHACVCLLPGPARTLIYRSMLRA